MNIVTKIDEQHLAYWADYKPRRITMKAPAGMDTCTDCAAVGTISEVGEPVVRVAWKPTPGEVADLAAGGTIWLSTWGGLPPHMLEVQEPGPGDALAPLASRIFNALVDDAEERGFRYGEAELAECRREARLIVDALYPWRKAPPAADTCEHKLLPDHCASCKTVDA